MTETKPAFRIAHLSDLHLSYGSGRVINSSGINIREQDGYDAFHELVDDVIRAEVDTAIVAGDIFHSPKPTIRSISEAQRGFRKLADAGITVYMLAGNHDASDIRSDVAASKILDQPSAGIFSHSEPYVRYEIADGIHLHLVSHHMYSLQHDTMLDVNPISDEVNIFCTHGSVIDAITKIRLSTDESPREVIIPDFILNEKDWSYRLLGHIHERGFVGSSDGVSDTGGLKTFYNGSLVRRGFSDAEGLLGRGWTLWSIDTAGNFTPEFRTVKQRAQFDFSSIDCGDLDAADISDLIVSNLKTTKESQLPILRQKLHNITPAKHGALDWSTINMNAGHALSWKLDLEKIKNPMTQRAKPVEDNEDSADDSVEEESGEDYTFTAEGDLIEVYDDFIQNSETAQGVEEHYRDRAVKLSRDVIHKSREDMLSEDQ